MQDARQLAHELEARYSAELSRQQSKLQDEAKSLVDAQVAAANDNAAR